jgi:hypothetical protein
MRLASRRSIVGSVFVVGLFLISCSDSGSLLRPTQASDSKGKTNGGVTTFSVPIPPDDCSVDPSGYGCTRYTYDTQTTGCEQGCTTYALTTAQKNGIHGALAHIVTSDPECVTLANYAIHVMNIDHIRWYEDPFAGATAPWGDIHFNTMGGYNDDPWIHVSDWALNNSGGELTKTLIHEAVHGYYGVSDAGNQPEDTAQRCYEP